MNTQKRDEIINWFALASFFLFFVSSQINFIFPGALELAYILIFIFSLVVMSGGEIEKVWFKYIILFFVIFVLSLIVYFYGGRGDLPPRPLFVYSFLLVCLFFVGANLNRSEILRERAFDVVRFSLCFEVFIVFAQFSYLEWGVGLAPRAENAEWSGSLTGSYGNPNNVSVIIVLTVLFLIVVKKIRFDIFGFGVLLASGGAVLILLSRTALIGYLTVFFYFFLKESYLVNFKLSGKFLRVFVLAIICGVLAVGVNLEGFESNVIARSVAKFSTINALVEDQSTEFRVLSSVRLVENIGRLGFGTMSDLNYGKFFASYDSPLAKMNPHSFIVEISFLFGYVGLVISIIFFCFLFYDIYSGSVSFVFSCYVMVLFLLFQFVPSTVFRLPMFFYVMVLICIFGGDRAARQTISSGAGRVQ